MRWTRERFYKREQRCSGSCPIALHPAIAAAEWISFWQVNRQTGNRFRQQLVDSVTGEVVQAHDKGRGYEFGERQVLMVEVTGILDEWETSHASKDDRWLAYMLATAHMAARPK